VAVIVALVAGSLTLAGGVANASSITFTVNDGGDGNDANVGDGVCATSTGTCTLRAAIEEANAGGGPHTIAFALPTTGSNPATITVTTQLPDVVRPLIIDGTTQAGGIKPAVVNGSGVTGTVGLFVNDATGTSTIRELDIEGFGVGVELASGGNTVIGDRIGGGSGTGIYIAGGSNSNRILGNYVGTLDGVTADANGSGIEVLGNDNIIGGSVAGQGNLLSGNTNDGIFIGPGAVNVTGNVVEGNLVGTRSDGQRSLPNGNGIVIQGGGPQQPAASNNSIGPGNVISGNIADGLILVNSMTTANTVTGNFIGTDPSGGFAVRNGADGVFIDNAPSNTIGGTTASAANLISGNGNSGVEIAGASSAQNLVEGNFIGTDVNGAGAVGNLNGGVYIDGGAPDNSIGGAEPGAGNVISGNAGDGVTFTDNGTTGNQLLGNVIGTNLAGTVSVPNSHGVFVFAASEVVGAPGAGNLISGNLENGIFMSGSTGVNEVIQANKIGTNGAGTGALPNGADGILVTQSSGDTIGGTTIGAGNLISGNTGTGIEFFQSGSNSVTGNMIGTSGDGATAVPNAVGILINNSASDTVGGTAPGAGNLISGNTGDGVHITGAQSVSDIVLGNLIGTDRTGTASIGNGNGVEVEGGAGQAAIGGVAAGSGNVISANFNGVVLSSSTAVGQNLVQGNEIGTSLGGAAALGNNLFGVFVNGSPNNTIGGTTTAARNVISGNGTGVRITTNGASGNVVEGNFVGTDATGTKPLGNVNEGIFLDNAPNNIFGGTLAGSGNVVSANGASGIRLLDTQATGNKIQGNDIGTDASGTKPLANAGNGVFIVNASSNTVGSAKRNVIAFNGGDGVLVQSGVGNLISRNSISGNVTGGISLGTGANNNQSAPVLLDGESGSNGTVISGTLASAPLTTYTIELFSNAVCDSSGSGQGRTFLGAATATTDGSGNATFIATVAKELRGGTPVTSTATDPGMDTSQFSACLSAQGPSTVYIRDAVVTQPKSGTATARFLVTLSPASAQTVTVHYATSDGTALAGTDYASQLGVVTFAAGQTAATIGVTIDADAASSPNESFFVNLSSPTGSVIGDTKALGTIVNGGPVPRPSLYITNATVVDGGSVNARVTVTLSGRTAKSVTVGYSTSNGAAIAGTDFVAKSGTLTFAPGQTSLTINIAILDDTVVEGTEDFVVNLAAPTNATLGDGTATVTILDDD
jgi:hypothetical protein